MKGENRENMGKHVINGIDYSGGSGGSSGGGGDNSVEILYADYLALSDAERNNGTIYYITDANPVSVGDEPNMKYDPETDIKYLKNQDGEWVEVGYGGLLRNYLYNSGDAFAEKTGGYEALGISNSSSHAGNEKAPVLTMESNHMNIVWAGNYSYTMGGVLNKKAIDLTEANKMYVTYNASSTGTNNPRIYFIIGTKNTTPLNNLVQQDILELNSTSASGTIEIDVSAISGVVYYGVLFAISDGGNVNQEVNISSIWTE